MSQVKECLQRPKECAKIPIAVPKATLKQVETKNGGLRRVLTCETIKNRFKYVQPCRRNPYKPVSQSPNVSSTPFTNDSVYNHSYYHHSQCGNRPKPVMHKDHIVMAGKFQDQTSQRISYPAQCVSVVQKVVPKENSLQRAEGPMRMMTTQQHDYYGPCEDHPRRNKKIVQADNLAVSSDSPMANLTTTHCSYQPVCGVREKNFKSEQCYTAPVEKMDLNTTQRSSYKKLGQQEKVQTPWVDKPSYQKSINTVDYCSVYNYSFKEPGGYMDKDNCDSAVNLTVDSCNTYNCYPFSCLADNIDSELKSRFTKAHEFDD